MEHIIQNLFTDSESVIIAKGQLNEENDSLVNNILSNKEKKFLKDEFDKILKNSKLFKEKIFLINVNFMFRFLTGRFSQSLNSSLINLKLFRKCILPLLAKDFKLKIFSIRKKTYSELFLVKKF